MNKLVLGERTIEMGSRPFVIAELSANHNKSLTTALELVDIAALCGADAIKLQTYLPESLTLNSFKKEFFIPVNGNPWAGQRLWELYEQAYTPWEWHEPIFARARAHDLKVISTVFDAKSLEFLVNLGVDAIKIASFELINLPLIKNAALTGLPLIISTGMGTLEEIREVVVLVSSLSKYPPLLLKCTSAYPAKNSDANIRTILDLKRHFPVPIGLSDHSMSFYAAAAAVALGACCVEKHITLSRNSGGPDASFSLEPKEFSEMVSVIHGINEALGRVEYGVQESESSSVWERPSIWVTKNVGQDEIFTPDNIRILRPSGGLHPREYFNVIGKRAALPIDEAVPLAKEHIKH